jgi:hypothetical protein
MTDARRRACDVRDGRGESHCDRTVQRMDYGLQRKVHLKSEATMSATSSAEPLHSVTPAPP